MTRKRVTSKRAKPPSTRKPRSTLNRKEYVDHPRFGSRPRFTALDVDADDSYVFLHWNTRRYSAKTRELVRQFGFELPKIEDDGTGLIPGTAIEADLSKQSPATIQVTHYYDVEKICVECKRRFIFFAEEQKYWYEELQFPLEADCIRCYPCRRRTKELDRLRKRYEKLLAVKDRSQVEEEDSNFCRLELVEAGLFNQRQLDSIRAFLKKFPQHPRATEIRKRIQILLQQTA